MTSIATKLGTFGAGLLGGLMVTFLFLSMTLAADENGPNSTGLKMTDFMNNGRPMAQGSSRIAGPPPLALRVSTGQSPSPDKTIFLPLIIKGP